MNKVRDNDSSHDDNLKGFESIMIAMMTIGIMTAVNGLD